MRVAIFIREHLADVVEHLLCFQHIGNWVVILNEHLVKEDFMFALQAAHIAWLLHRDSQVINDGINESSRLAGLQLPCLAFGDLKQIPRLKL